MLVIAGVQREREREHDIFCFLKLYTLNLMEIYIYTEQIQCKKQKKIYNKIDKHISLASIKTSLP